MTAKTEPLGRTIKQPIGGLDTLRVLALFLVTWQHAGSVFGDYETLQWRGISPGQLGVAVFCAISGYLAFLFHRADTLQWLWRRVLTLFPAYWLVTCAGFLLAWSGYSDKPVTWALFLSQMLGTGYFTHGWALVNVVSWFLSLILFCYLIAFVVMTFSPSRKVSVACLFVIGVVCLCLLLTRWEVGLSRHVLGFVGGGLLAFSLNRRVLVGFGVVLVFLGFFEAPSFSYSGAALLLLLWFVYGECPDLACIQWISRYSYEYFLIHGIALVGVSRYLPNPWFGVPIAVVLSFGAAVVLSWVIEEGQGLLGRT